jgi:hypothetical protein
MFAGATLEFAPQLQELTGDIEPQLESVGARSVTEGEVKQSQEHVDDNADDSEQTKLAPPQAELVRRAQRSIDSVLGTMSGRDGLETMQAFATALQANNVELFGRYDRLQAEASLRLNIAAPLTTLLELVIWQAPLPLWIKLGLSLVPVGLAALLLRQSLLRVRSANQVLVRAQLVGIFDTDDASEFSYHASAR